jgi:hypothetical protein
MNDVAKSLYGGRNGMAPQLRQRLAGWSGHVSSWLDQTDVPVHTLRYEDLTTDPVGGFSAALKFAGREATMAEIERAVRHADFAELQRQERERGFTERMSRTAPFFRSGRAGDWRDSLSADQVGRIEEAHGPTMRRLGYQLSGEPRPAANSQAAATCRPEGIGL